MSPWKRRKRLHPSVQYRIATGIAASLSGISAVALGFAGHFLFAVLLCCLGLGMIARLFNQRVYTMNELSVIPLGVGDAFSAVYYSSCLAIGSGSEWLLVDCPHPIRKMLKEASESSGVALDVGDFSAIALTHLHADHASGLEGFFYFSRFVLKRQPQLLAHAEVLDRVWPDHLAAGMDCLMDLKHQPKAMKADEYFEGTALRESHPYSIDGFSIECRKTIHHVPTTAFRIRWGDKCVAYSADTAFDMQLIDWLAEADLIIHETNVGVHTPYEKLAALPANLRAKMRLIHYPDSFDLEGSVIEPLRQGVRYQV